MREEVLDPLGMKNTGLDRHTARDRPGFVQYGLGLRQHGDGCSSGDGRYQAR